MVTLWLTVGGSTGPFSTAVAPLCFPTSSLGGFESVHVPCALLLIFCLFDQGPRVDRYSCISSWGFFFHLFKFKFN